MTTWILTELPLKADFETKKGRTTSRGLFLCGFELRIRSPLPTVVANLYIVALVLFLQNVGGKGSHNGQF
jgi:hypothetical protein